MSVTYYEAIVYDEIKQKEASRMWSSIYRDALVRAQNIMADLMNPHYEKWNAEFDQLYPNCDEDRFDPDSKYMKFIVAKYNEILNKVVPVDWRVTRYYSNEEGCISIETIDGKRFSLLFKPAGES